MSEGILVKILGDFGPFSRMGKSIGYQVTVGGSSYLVDCGSPLFQQIGGHGLKEIKGLIITHCHDDHKRWFSDLALFNRYAPDVGHKVPLMTSEAVHEELVRASGPALDRSLSPDSMTIVDLPYEEFVDVRLLGPRARYRIAREVEEGGRIRMCIKDREGNVVPPDVAKIVMHPGTMNPRMLFRDPEYDEWIEPESFYPFSSDVFYERERNIHRDGAGFTIEAIKAPVWHGIPGIGIRISTGRETLIFSSDTVHDPGLWHRLFSEKRPQRLGMDRSEFEAAAVIYGDINDYVERIWSERRYREAMEAFRDAVVIHDVYGANSVVHTDYAKLKSTALDRTRTLLTHSPDRMTSEWALCDSGKTFLIKDGGFEEVVAGERYPMNADIYHKEGGRYYVGYRNESGRYTVYEKDGLLGLSAEDGKVRGTPLFRVDLYEDISGRYFPVLEDETKVYRERADGRVEVVEISGDGSRGRIVESVRDRMRR